MKYEEAAKAWAAHRLSRAGVPFDEIASVYFDSETYTGCPTCGSETSYHGRIFFVFNKKHDSRRIDFDGLHEILQELFEISEPALAAH